MNGVAIDLKRVPRGHVLNALVAVDCTPSLSDQGPCARCREIGRDGVVTISDRPDGGTKVSCSSGCSESEIITPPMAAYIAEWAEKATVPVLVRDGSRTGTNRGTAPGSESLRDEPVREPVRTSKEKPAPRTGLPSFETLDAFLDRTATLPDPEWLIEELVPSSGRVHFAAAPSAGKTFLCLAVAKAAALKGRVVYLVLEEGGAKATGNRFRSLRFPEGLPVLVLHQAGITLADHTPELVAMLDRGVNGPAPVLVLDPWASVFRGNENETEQIAAATETMNTLMRADPRLLLVVPHHTSKAGERGDVGTPLHAGRGGSGLPGWADVQLNLKHISTPKGSGRVEFDALMAKNRDGERDYTIRVCIELGSGEVTFKPASEAQQESKTNDLRERLVKFISEASEPLTKNKISAGVKGTKAEKLALVDALTDEGVLVNQGAGWVIAPRTGGAQ